MSDGSQLPKWNMNGFTQFRAMIGYHPFLFQGDFPKCISSREIGAGLLADKYVNGVVIH